MEGRSLSERLREAALQRARTDGELVDDCVLDEEGVLDLRALEPTRAPAPVGRPAAALVDTRGRLGDAGEVGDLYDESPPPTRRWRLGRRSAVPAPPPVTTSPPEVHRRSAALTNLSGLPLSAADDATDPPGATAPATIDLTAGGDDAVIDLGEPAGDADTAGATDTAGAADGDRPTRPCPTCGGTGRRDLFDRFSQMEFYSCDDCLHMWQVKRDS